MDDFDDLLTGASVHAIPMSALHGDNVITTSDRTPWFDGPPLLEYLETVHVHRNAAAAPFRFPVQMVLRPDDVFRGYAGQIVSGTVRAGDRVTAWPSGRSARVNRIVTFDGDLDLAFAPMSVTLTLDDEIDISRGDVLTLEPPLVSQRFEAEVVWMDERPLDPGRVYLLKHGHAHGDRRGEPRAAAQPDRHGAGVHRAAARLRPLRRQSRHRAASS